MKNKEGYGYDYIPPAGLRYLTGYYDFFCILAGLGPRFKERVLLSAPIERSGIIADIGCATGVFLKVAAKKFPMADIIGIDPDAQALAIAGGRLEPYHNVRLLKGFAEALPLADSFLDVCFSTLTLHHLPDDAKAKAIKEIYRVTKNGGRAVIADFGKTEKNLFLLRLLLPFEKWDYLVSNFMGKIEECLSAAGFKNIKTVGTKFPCIRIIVAEKQRENELFPET